MKEIIVLCPNRAGSIADISLALAAKGINIESFDAEGAVSNGVVILCVDRYDEALQTLTEAGFHAVSEDAAVVKIEDKPGALARIAVRLKEGSINVRSLRIVQRADGYCLAAIVAEDQDAMRELLADVILQTEG